MTRLKNHRFEPHLLATLPIAVKASAGLGRVDLVFQAGPVNLAHELYMARAIMVCRAGFGPTEEGFISLMAVTFWKLPATGSCFLVCRGYSVTGGSVALRIADRRFLCPSLEASTAAPRIESGAPLEGKILPPSNRMTGFHPERSAAFASNRRYSSGASKS